MQNILVLNHSMEESSALLQLYSLFAFITFGMCKAIIFSLEEEELSHEILFCSFFC